MITAHPQIKGLYICEDIIDKKEEKELVAEIYKNDWLTDLHRAVQHYGYKYDYKKRRIDRNDLIGDLPVWTNKLEKNIFKVLKKNKIDLPYDSFDQLIINEYTKNQGITKHTDCVPCFMDGIFTITLINHGTMTFRRGEESHDVLLNRRSVAILTGESRYNWTHEIATNKNKHFSTEKPRVSITFRKCIL